MDQYIDQRLLHIRNEFKLYTTLKAIHQGCKDGNLDVIRSAIEAYEKDELTNTMVPLADAKLDHGDKTWPNYIIEMAASSFNPEILALILEKNLYRIKENNCMTPMHFLVKVNYVETGGLRILKSMLKMLKDVGFGINDQDNDGLTPLHCVCRDHGENLELVKTLIKAGADVNRSDNEWMIPLHYVCKDDEEKLQLVKTLIEAGSKLNTHDRNWHTPLHYVCKDHWENLELAKTLIDAGADVDCQDYNEWTPLHYICGFYPSKLKIAQSLVAAGADVKKQDNDGETALDFVCEDHKENLELVKILIEAGANIKYMFAKADFDKNWHDKCLTILKSIIAYGLDINKYLTLEQITCLLREDAKLRPENSIEMYEFLRQSGFRFTDTLLKATSWISCTQNPLSLQRLSANKIRRCLGPKLHEKIKALDKEYSPLFVKDFIMMKAFC